MFGTNQEPGQILADAVPFMIALLAAASVKPAISPASPSCRAESMDQKENNEDHDPTAGAGALAF